jgi:hypothetical protein
MIGYLKTLAILANQKILTLDYWKTAHDLRAGDYVFDKEGQLQKVILVQEYRATDCYEVSFNDHLTVAGDAHLGFQIEDKRYRDRLLQYKGKFKFKRPLKFRKVSDIPADNLTLNNGFRAFSIPTTKPLQFPHQTLPVPPFIFGFWFFTHETRQKRMHFTKGNHDLLTEKFKDSGYSIIERGKHSNGERYFSVLPTIDSHLSFNIPYRIPNNYLLASAEQRLELLRGILCAKSKSYSKKTGLFRFSHTRLPIVQQIQALVESLGHKTTLEINEQRKSYILIFRSKLQLVPNQTPYTKPVVHQARRYIKAITKLPSQLCVHIETEGADNSYLVGEGFIAVC